MTAYLKIEHHWEAITLVRGEPRRVKVICNDNPLRARRDYQCIDMISHELHLRIGEELYNAKLLASYLLERGF